MFSTSLLPLLSLLLFTTAQTTPDPSDLLNCSYVNPIFQQSRQNVEQNSLSSFKGLISRKDFPVGWVGQNAWISISQWDQDKNTSVFQDDFTGNASYYAQHPGGCFKYWHQPSVDCFNDDAAWAALANLGGFHAYGNQSFYDRALSIWTFISNHGFINDTVIQEGYLKGTKYPNATLNRTCNGQSMHGGVFEENGATQDPALHSATANVSIDSGSTLLYGLLNTMLYKHTQQDEYKERAYDALQFADRFLVDPIDYLVKGPMNATTCTVANSTFTHSVATYIQAYALLGNLTNNATAVSLARRVALASMTTDHWNTEDGVIKEGQGKPDVANVEIGFKSIFVRALASAYPFMDTEMQIAILQYINIQYWSMVNFDSDDKKAPTWYGRNWTGPGYTVVTGRTQAAALDVLNALRLNPDSAFPASNGANVTVIISQ